MHEHTRKVLPREFNVSLLITFTANTHTNSSRSTARHEMVCTFEASAMTAGICTSTQLSPVLVEQTRPVSMSPCQHLSFASAPRFPFYSNTMRPSFPVEMFESTSSGASDPTELPFLKVNDCVLSPAKHNSMSLNGGTSWIEQQRKSTVQRKRLAMMPRSISIADMQAGSKHSVEQFAPSFRSSPPSIDYLGNHAHVQSGSQPLSERSQSQLLLPNDYQHQQASLTPNSSFTSDEKKLRRRIHYKSYQDLHILSMYQEKPSMKRSDSTGSSASTTFEPDDESSNGSLYSEGSEELSPLPVTPIDDVPLAEDASPEVKLLLNDDLKKQRSNARQVHVIEHHQDKTCLKQADQHDILPVRALFSNLTW